MADLYCDSVLGDDSTGDGSSGNPYKTVDECLDNASDNDTVYLVPNGSANTYDFETGSAPAGITIKSTQTLVDRPNYTNAYWDGGSTTKMISTNGDITVEDVVIQNVNSTSGASPFKFANVAGTITMTFNRCVVDETVNNFSTGGRGGFVGNGNSVSLGNPTLINVYFNDCRISNFGGEGFVYATVGIVKYYFNETTIYNDSSHEGKRLVASYSTSDLEPELTNCIIRNEHATDLGIFVRYNNTSGRGGAILDHCNYTGEDTTEMAGNTTTDCTTDNPQLRDPSAGDYSLENDSPVLGTGKLV